MYGQLFRSATERLKSQELQPTVEEKAREARAFMSRAAAQTGLEVDLDPVGLNSFFLGFAQKAKEEGKGLFNTKELEDLKFDASGSIVRPTQPAKGGGYTPRSTGYTPRSTGYSPSGSSDILDMVAGWESFSPTAYEDYGQTSIGYGTRAREGETEITQEEARRRLEEEFGKAREEVLARKERYGYDWNQNQIDALSSFAYNLGGGAIDQVTDNGKRSNEEIATMMLEYNKAGGKVLPGLVDRRRAEQELFLRKSVITGESKLEFAMGPSRPLKPNPEVLEMLDKTALETFGPGARIRITSGKEEEGKRYGSIRHPAGLAVDIEVYYPDGTLLTLDDPTSVQFARNAIRNGALGIGAGMEYMGNKFHIDMFPRESYTSRMGPIWGSWAVRHQSELFDAWGMK